MRNAATVFIIFAGVVAAYFFMLHPVLHSWQRFKALHDTLEAVEANAWFRFSMAFRGLKTRLWSWFLIILPLMLSLLEIAGALNSTIVIPLLPEKVQPFVPLIFTVIGVVTLQLRRITTTPIDSPIPAPSETATTVSITVPTPADRPNAEVVVAPPTALEDSAIVKAVIPAKE